MKPQALYNPFVKFILHSPLHGLMSHNTLLLTFTGRKSGKAYTTPINYARDGETLMLVTHRGRSWWKNLQAPTPVTAYMAGSARAGLAQVEILDTPHTVTAIEHVYRGIPPERAVQLAPESVIIKITLN